MGRKQHEIDSLGPQLGNCAAAIPQVFDMGSSSSNNVTSYRQEYLSEMAQ
ncbi:hypothetical protein PtrSN002B_005332 [Pyrenophora tritici-repentis]|uniref:Uncharacterized protein n=1 Tax=Pyrenophora tritici-repentis TaxID=45151 RepID=A0A2W1E1Q7_9PLEO|nr:hypothetical protein PtrV1_05457 [Pyrenophora tritici-repentis]KAF7572773.1 hypothetical protein PtrM4_076780 [Pyrenophora tritici-repentis]KAI0583211.1 hypothetical protein Alg130_05789 [Pyrenophora tritici-repentis]KAI0588101.1 hypothetical protein Alg215_01017 [Pyrenophora tritici-repentis]KAI1509420.1 hypothetical protein Ptr86124_011500 [Pyrenophora tritici-repentis]